MADSDSNKEDDGESQNKFAKMDFLPKGGKGTLKNEDIRNVRFLFFQKVFAIGVIISIFFVFRSRWAGVSVAILIIPLWLFCEKLYRESSSVTTWEEEEKKEKNENLPLRDDVQSLQRAEEGNFVKQALFEERIKDQIIFILKREHNLSERDIEVLKDTPEKGFKKIKMIDDNIKDFLIRAKELDDVTSSSP